MLTTERTLEIDCTPRVIFDMDGYITRAISCPRRHQKSFRRTTTDASNGQLIEPMTYTTEME